MSKRVVETSGKQTDRWTDFDFGPTNPAGRSLGEQKLSGFQKSASKKVFSKNVSFSDARRKDPREGIDIDLLRLYCTPTKMMSLSSTRSISGGLFPTLFQSLLSLGTLACLCVYNVAKHNTLATPTIAPSRQSRSQHQVFVFFALFLTDFGVSPRAFLRFLTGHNCRGRVAGKIGPKRQGKKYPTFFSHHDRCLPSRCCD